MNQISVGFGAKGFETRSREWGERYCVAGELNTVVKLEDTDQAAC